MWREEKRLTPRHRLAAIVLIALLTTATGAALATSSSSSSASSVAAAFNKLPASDFPGTVTPGASEHGKLKVQVTVMGHPMTLTASAGSITNADIGTLSRTRSDYVLRFTHRRYKVSPIKLPNGLTVASQTITLDPHASSTLTINRQTGAVASELHWIVNAPNTLYNGSHSIKLPDTGRRGFVSFKRLGHGRYSFHIISNWHGSVTLKHWRVSGKSVPGGHVSITGTWNGLYVLTVKGS